MLGNQVFISEARDITGMRSPLASDVCMEMRLRPGAISSLALELCLPKHGQFKLQSVLHKACLACLVFFSMDGKLTWGGWVPHVQPWILHKQLLNPVLCQALFWVLGLGEEATLFCPHICRRLEKTCGRCMAEARGC